MDFIKLLYFKKNWTTSSLYDICENLGVLYIEYYFFANHKVVYTEALIT